MTGGTASGLKATVPGVRGLTGGPYYGSAIQGTGRRGKTRRRQTCPFACFPCKRLFLASLPVWGTAKGWGKHLDSIRSLSPYQDEGAHNAGQRTRRPPLELVLAGRAGRLVLFREHG